MRAWRTGRRCSVMSANLLVNGGFESELLGWEVACSAKCGAVHAATSAARTGDRSLSVAARADEWTSVSIRQRFQTRPPGG